jgi:hypothetical protein
LSHASDDVGSLASCARACISTSSSLRAAVWAWAVTASSRLAAIRITLTAPTTASTTADATMTP